MMNRLGNPCYPALFRELQQGKSVRMLSADTIFFFLEYIFSTQAVDSTGTQATDIEGHLYWEPCCGKLG
jgi:hypothetical protein